MKYQVIARKFRPQAFAEVVGQKPIVQTLQNALTLSRIGHAYLFCGPRGVGKTTLARIFAKALNCVEGPTVTPCNTCPSCTEIAANQSMDVLEIDAASNTGVDNVRELRESARYVPSRDRYKIFIIDEVHMLSTSAFNALLKILEEPPAHVIFIMATTERHKLPATILSRCQQFVFRTIAPEEIHAHLRDIAGREGATITDSGLNYVVRAAEGSMRDAQSLLDQIISFGGQEIANSEVRDVLGFIPDEILDRTVDALAAGSSRDLIEIVGVVVDQGLNLQQFVRECIARIRDLLMLKLDLSGKVLAGEEEKAAMTARTQTFSEQDLVRYFDLLMKLEADLRLTSQPRLHVEIGLIKLAKLGKLRDIEEVLRDLREGVRPEPTASPAQSSGVPAAQTAAPGPSTPPSPPEPPSPGSSAPPAPAPARSAPPAPPAPAAKPLNAALPKIDLPLSRPRPPAAAPRTEAAGKPPAAGSAPTRLPEGEARAPAVRTRTETDRTLDKEPSARSLSESFLKRVEQKSAITAAYARKALSIQAKDGEVQLLMGDWAGHELLDDSEHRSVLEAAAQELLGNAASVSLIMKDESASKGGQASGTAVAAAKEEPLVKRFLEVFRGDIAQVKPAKGENNEHAAADETGSKNAGTAAEADGDDGR